MRRVVGDFAAFAVLATLALAGLLVYQPVGRTLVIHAYLLVLGGLVMLASAAALRVVLPPRRSAFAAALHRPEVADERPPQLVRAERTTALGHAYAFELHTALRPRLREIASARLARRGLVLDSPAGRAAVGEEAWELLRPDREEPVERFGPGIAPDRLRAVVSTLENLRP